jgi:hypothetical protein
MSQLGLSPASFAHIASELSGREIDEIVYESDVSLDNEDDQDDTEELAELLRQETPVGDINDDRVARNSEATQLSKLVEDDIHQNKQAWRDIYVAHGTLGLSREVMKEEIKERLKSKRVFKDKDETWATDSMDHCLMSTDKRVIESVLYGNVALDSKSDRVLQSRLSSIRDQSKLQPGIYYQQLVDEHGRSPSTAELLRMADMMESYVKGCAHASVADLSGSPDARLANLIDNFKQPGEVSLETSMSGHRKYMCSNKTVDAEWIADGQIKKGKGTENQQLQLQSKGIVSQSHILGTDHFIKMLRKRLHKITLSEHNKPLQFPLCEVGYSIRCVERLKQHASHNSSNYVMDLAEAVLNARRADFDCRYTIAQNVIYLIWDASHAEIAEIGWSKLAESNTHNAGGFSHQPAGMSNHSASTVSAREWDTAKAYMIRRSPWVHNLQYRLSKLEEEVLQAEKEAEAQTTAVKKLEVEKEVLEAQVEARCREVEKEENEVQILLRRIDRVIRTNAAAVEDYIGTLIKIVEMLHSLEPRRRAMRETIELLERHNNLVRAKKMDTENRNVI